MHPLDALMTPQERRRVSLVVVVVVVSLAVVSLEIESVANILNTVCMSECLRYHCYGNYPLAASALYALSSTFKQPSVSRTYLDPCFVHLIDPSTCFYWAKVNVCSFETPDWRCHIH